jgi:hypothetical protein
VTGAASRSRLAAREIDELLRQQRSRELEGVFARSLIGDWLCGPFECVRLIVETSMTLRQGRLARRWLAKLPPFCTSKNVPVAMALALRARQATLVLTLYACFRNDLLRQEAGVRLALASDILHLALRTRLPKGRNGAWKKHRELLKLAYEITASLPADAPEHWRGEAEAMRARLQEFQRWKSVE